MDTSEITSMRTLPLTAQMPAIASHMRVIMTAQIARLTGWRLVTQLR